MTTLIGRIAIHPTVVRPGESACVEVFDKDDSPLDASSVQVTINGTSGAVQFLHFPSVGECRIIVRVL